MTASPARRLLAPLNSLYRVGLALRERRLATGREPIRRLRLPVVSIGNLSTGGSGKTPLAMALARALTARGLYVDILSRGYRRQSSQPAKVDPQGTAQLYGDEPLLLAQSAGVPVYVAPQRYEAGLLAEAELPDLARAAAAQPHGIHLLDDGFQHRQLYRDLDILLLNRADVNDRLLPAGNLREALSAAQRADVIAIPADEPDLEPRLRALGFRGPIWRLHRRMIFFRPSHPVLAFCGIARPEQFFSGLEQSGVQLAGRLAFPDHHTYSTPDLRRIEQTAARLGATALITTQKDKVRLGLIDPPIPLLTVVLRTEIDNGPAAVDWLLGYLSSK